MSGRIYLSSPDVTDAEEQALVRAIRSGWIAPLGPMVDAFEGAARRCGRPHRAALSSGTAALHLGLLELGVAPGDVVLTSTLTFAATANAVVYTGAEPVFVDCDPRPARSSPAAGRGAQRPSHATGRRSPRSSRSTCSARCADHDHIDPVATVRRPGALRRGRVAGRAATAGPPRSFGTIAAFSFNGNKIMTTTGGGMLLTDDAASPSGSGTCALRPDSRPCTTSTPRSATTTA